MTTEQMTDDMLIDLLNKQPAMRSRIIELLEVVSNSSGNFITADSAEDQVIKELQKFGGDILSAWALNTEQVCGSDLQLPEGKVVKHGKKKSTGIQSTEELS
jgi:hypothetical protein